MAAIYLSVYTHRPHLPPTLPGKACSVHQHLYTLLRIPGWLEKRSKERPEA